METKQWVVDKCVKELNSYPQILEAANEIKRNEIVAFPTETVYGLGANAYSDEAIDKIYYAKGRPSDNPLIVHISSMEQLADIVEKIPLNAHRLMEVFWPGPLTIILKQKQNNVSKKVTAGLDTVGVRMPDNPVALALIEAAGVPLAAPSANRSGKPSPTKASHVFQDLNGRIAGIVDGGSAGVGLESTVIDCTKEIPMILRPGGISEEQIAAIIGEVTTDAALKNENEQPKSPGMKYTHYAPQAPVYLVDGSSEWIQGLINEKRDVGLKVGLLTTEEMKHLFTADSLLICGEKSDLSTVAESLFHILRKFDEQNVDIIFSEVFEEDGIGVAIMNRLDKAAGHRILREKAE